MFYMSLHSWHDLCNEDCVSDIHRRQDGADYRIRSKHHEKSYRRRTDSGRHAGRAARCHVRRSSNIVLSRCRLQAASLDKGPADLTSTLFVGGVGKRATEPPEADRVTRLLSPPDGLVCEPPCETPAGAPVRNGPGRSGGNPPCRLCLGAGVRSVSDRPAESIIVSSTPAPSFLAPPTVRDARDRDGSLRVRHGFSSCGY